MSLSSKKIKSIIKNGDIKMPEDKKTPAIDEVEKLKALVQHRAKPVNKRQAKTFFPGDTYEQAGLDKLEVIGTGKATRDLDAKIPASTKRTVKDAEKKGSAKSELAQVLDAFGELAAQNAEIIKLLSAKK